MSSTPSLAERQHAEDLIRYIDHSPSPWHVVETTVQRLTAAGFEPLLEGDSWSLQPQKGYFVCRGGSSLVAFRTGSAKPEAAGFRIIGAHTDSPTLRLKPQGGSRDQGLLRLGVEVYGSPILASYADRDLFLAGRVSWSTPEGRIESRSVRLDRLRLRLPNLAIHLNRGVNEEGLKFNKQSELPLILAQTFHEELAEAPLMRLLAETLKVDVASLFSLELQVADAQPGAFWGAQEEFLSTGRLDNQSSCHAALLALLNQRNGPATAVIALFDHEEVGSESAQGAGSVFLAQVLSRVVGDIGEPLAKALAKSLMISADAAHAYHPNFPGVYEPLHAVQINQGVALKINVNQRYATDGPGAAYFRQLAAKLNRPIQTYVHRSDLGCGSTIGPITAARLGIPVIDCGIPMWAMHSLRESAGVADALALTQLMTSFFEENGNAG